SRFRLQHGDGLFLYTDGVTEAISDRKEFFGEERLGKFLTEAPRNKADDLLHNLFDILGSFSRNARQSDDVAVLSVFYRGIPQSLMIHEIILSNQIAEVGHLIDFVNGFCRRNGVDDDVAGQVAVALEELFVNSCHYGHRDGSRHDIKVWLALENQMLVWCMEDGGRPFNPLDYVSVGQASSVDDMIVGGQGIRLVRNLTDSLTYRRENGTNVITGRKRI
ncbi:MAG: ATP-binding protein, partial [Myxococcota bacterium]